VSIALVVLVPIFVWGVFAPFPAFYVHAVLVGALQGVLVLQSWLGRPRLEDRTARPDPKQAVLLKYHQYFRQPVAARGLSRILTSCLLISLGWAGWLLFQRAWFAALVAGC
jgi:hypothetical protein